MSLSPPRVKLSKWVRAFSSRKNFFISYPKSGRTWVRFMVDDYKVRLFGIEVGNVFEVERKLRLKHHVQWTHLGGFQKNPYYAMTPNRLELLRGVPCVFMTRNLHATLASAWFQVTERLGVSLPDKEAFLHGTNFGVMHIISFHNAWIEISKNVPDVKYVSYARLKADTRSEFIRILEALGLPVVDELVNATLEAGSFGSMKALGNSEAYKGTILAPADSSNPNSAKVRNGSTDSYKTVFNEEQNAFISEMIDRFFVGRDDPRFAESVGKMDR